MSLILRKGYEAITVQDIIDEADVARSTFYAHYTGKEDLLRSSFQTLRAELAEAQRAARGESQEVPLGFSLAMFEHASGYTDVYRAGRRARRRCRDQRNPPSSFGDGEEGAVRRPARRGGPA
jgi:AcrR family transcriptional regulator